MPLKPLPRLLTPLALAAAALAARPVQACGPDLPVAMLQRDHTALCATPSLRLASVLAELTPSSELRAVTTSVADAEQADLRAALFDAGLGIDEIELRVAAVAAYRAQFEDAGRKAEPALPLPELPEEFRLYLLGARAWHAHDPREAERLFRAVLALPPAQRRWRSTWAAYMLARSQHSYGDRCRVDDRRYADVRRLAADGYRDSLGLAAASLGQQAQCWHFAGASVRAIELYLEQLATGDDTAANSIEDVLDAAFEPPEREGEARLVALARDPKLRDLVGAYLAAGGDAWAERTEIWLEVIEEQGIERVLAAGPLAWAAYESADMDAAARWAGLGASSLDEGDLLARWVLAKLELREGDVEVAAAALARIEPELAEATHADLRLGDWRYWAWSGEDRASASAAVELGVLELRRDRFVPALEAFVRGGSYLDAAYVAEQLLSFDELQTFLDGFDEAKADDAPRSLPFGRRLASAGEDAFSLEQRLRWLFARRLARAGQWRRALPYYPDQWRAEAEAQVVDLDALDDPELGNVQRARLLWRVAQRTRDVGMELRGTELEPDWALHDGQFEQATIWELRRGEQGPTGPSEAEVARRHRSWQATPQRRFHYRWVAADHAWEAAELLPDQHPATARVLCIAGNWIASRDPAEAQRFYQAMIRRNRAVDVAQWADAALWFPDPEQCALTGIDFAEPPVRVPIQAAPRRELSRRQLARELWPVAALFGLFGLVGYVLLAQRQ